MRENTVHGKANDPQAVGPARKSRRIRARRAIERPWMRGGGDEYVVEVLNSIEREHSFIPFPLVPIGEGDPLLYCDSCCRCGCLRMPRGLEAGFCIHCGHLYQVGDPDFWKTQDEHCAHCRPFQEYAHPGSRTLPARCGAPAPCSSREQLDALDEAMGRLYRFVAETI